MRVEFLGTGGFHPNDRRHTACIMLPEAGVILDAGTAMFRVRSRLQTRDVDLFLTHAHLDHIVGLPTLLVPLLTAEIETARLHGTRTTLEAVNKYLFAEPIFPILPGYDFVELVQDVPIQSGGIVRHKQLKHPGGCVGYRIDWPDRSLAYITDTTVDGSYDDFIRGVDLLIHECQFSDESAEWSAKTGHSNTTPVAELAARTDAGKLVLVHIDPGDTSDDPVDIDDARKIFKNTVLAEDTMVIDL